MANQNSNRFGMFLPTTYEYDVTDLGNINLDSDEFKELIVRLYQSINNIILTLNLKHTGYYTLTEFVNGKLWYPDPTASPTQNNLDFRQVESIVVPIGPLTNNSTKSVVTTVIVSSTSPSTFRVKNIQCVANKLTLPFSYVPIPYVSTAGTPESIELYLDTVVVAGIRYLRVNVSTISVATNWTLYTDVDVYIEYIRT